MKKILFLIFLIFCFANIYAFNISGTKLNLTGTLKNNVYFGKQDAYYLNKAKLKLDLNLKNIYSAIEFRGLNNSKNDINSIDVYQAYVNYYKKRYSVCIGKRSVMWGLGYFFNYSNVFFTPDPNNPKQLGEGINNLDFKYYPSNTSQFETIIFNTNDNFELDKLQNKKTSYTNFATRYLTTLNNSEFTLNYLKYKKQIMDNYPPLSIQSFIAEFKTNFVVGLWGSFNRMNVKGEKNHNIYTLGSDYTFGLPKDRSLYVVGEFSRDATLNLDLEYLKYQYNISYSLNFSQDILANCKNGAYFFTTSLNYLVNDYITASLFANKSQNIDKLGLFTMNSNNLITANTAGIELKTSF